MVPKPGPGPKRAPLASLPLLLSLCSETPGPTVLTVPGEVTVRLYRSLEKVLDASKMSASMLLPFRANLGEVEAG